MRLLALSVALMTLCTPKLLCAQSEETTDKISRGIMVIREFCGTQGNKSSQREFVGKLEGGITLRKIPGISGGGDLKYTDQEAEGLAGALFKELTDNATSLSKTQIECMSPFISRILDAILGPASRSDPPPEKDLSSYEVPNKEALCKRMNEVVISYRSSFRTIMMGEGNFPGQYKSKVILPNTQWCAVFTHPFRYYSCSIFYNEKNNHNAELKEKAYRKAVGECLGKNWASSDIVSNGNGGRSGAFQGNGNDPKVEIRSSKDKDGNDLVIYVQPPG
ncbi:hypothetical protein FBZ83_11712 [Azospirillum brasilense]|uniref:Uncharacterized protein n=1 Tax=Azospirillum brasilense TaxID=192 RepID=A0A560BW81_AZOBR|nr:hypothetical protein [Azospirillum brasilense]TWA76871.1 hypothetical protein FBZ83_11712 [Azospirillum brasilense]